MKLIENKQSLKNVMKGMKTGKAELTKLKDENEKIITNQVKILERIKQFYEWLYASNAQTDNIGEPNDKTPSILESETNHAIRQMKKGKAPGPD